MTIAGGVLKILGAKKESSWGVLAGASGGQLLRRVTSDLNLEKDTYKSNEIRPDQQTSDFRHGVHSVKGSINGELSPLTYEMFMAAVCRKGFVSKSNMTLGATTVTVAASGSLYTVTRNAGSWLTDGAKVGLVVRETSTLGVNSKNKNLYITALSALVMTVAVLNGTAMTLDSAVATTIWTFPGMTTWMPTSGQTDDSFTIEHWFSDIAQSEQFVGCKITQMDFDLPPTGMATVKITFLGKDMIPGVAQYFTTPTAATVSGVVAAVNGVLTLQGLPIALLSALKLTIKASMTADPVVGSNTYPAIIAGGMDVEGSTTVLFQDATVRDYFKDEVEVALSVCLSTGNSALADFISFSLPRIKLGGAQRNDGEKGLMMTGPFTALLATNGGAGIDHEQTTLMIHDSLAV